jgi:hypothetical protein
MRKFGASFLMALCFCAFTNKAMGQTWNIGNPNYSSNVTATLSEGTLTIRGSGNMVDFWDSSAGEAPWWVDNKHTAITKVIIQSGVTNIGNRAFKECTSLTSVEIQNTVKIIGRRAFDKCSSLPLIALPSSVDEIEGEAFYDCSKLAKVTIENGDSELKFTSFYYSGSEYSRGYKYDWFKNCPIQTLHLGRQYNSTSYQPFSGITTLTTLTIGNKVNSIVGSAFSGCSGLKTVTIESSNAVLNFTGSNTFANCPIEILTLGRDLSYYTGTNYIPFRGITALKTITIGNQVTEIGSNLFDGCTNLQSLIFNGNSVIEIGSSAFRDCSSLATALNLPSSVVTVGSSAFAGCRTLPSVVIPNSVNTIDSNAFSGCIQLKTVTINAGSTVLTFLSTNTFGNCPIETLSLGRDLSYNPGTNYIPFRGITALKTLIIGSQVTAIGQNLFNGCTGLTSVTNNATTPQTINANVFGGITVKNIPLTVPAESINLYKAANVWKDFFSINGQHTAVETIETVKFSVFPNPSKDEIFIQSEQPIKTVEILDISGCPIMNIAQLSANQSINVSHLPKGIYFVKTVMDSRDAACHVFTKKIIKE